MLITGVIWFDWAILVLDFDDRYVVWMHRWCRIVLYDLCAGRRIMDVDRNRFALNHCYFSVLQNFHIPELLASALNPEPAWRSLAAGRRKVTRSEYEWPYWKRLWRRRRNNRRRSRHGKRPFCFVRYMHDFFPLFMLYRKKNPLAGSIDVSSHFRHQDVTDKYIYIWI